MGTEIKKINKISPSLVFYLIHSMQIGVSILTFESSLAKAVEQDAWIVVLVSGLLIHVIIYFMYKLLSYKETSLIAVHTGLFKPFIGNSLTCFFPIVLFGNRYSCYSHLY